MCGKSLKVSLVSLGLFLLLSFSQSYSSCFADVTLTYEETQEILNEIEQSKTEYENVKKELQEVKTTCSEQKKSYEMQLQEVEKKNQVLKTGMAVTSTATIMSTIFIVILLII